MIRDYNQKNNTKISRGKPVERNKEWDQYENKKGI